MNVKSVLSFVVLTCSFSMYSMNSNEQLLLAAKAGAIEYVKAALDNGADITVQDHNDHNCTALHFAVRAQNQDLVKHLLSYGADVTQKTLAGCTPLHWAINYSDRAIVQLLVEYNADIQACNNEGVSILSYAVGKGDYELVKFLIDQGAEINSKDNKGWTALMLAVFAGHEKAVNLLLEAGADCNSISRLKNTALTLAVHKDYTSIVTSLLHSGVEVNVKDNKNCTPLYRAAEKGSYASALLLLKAGANANLPNLVRGPTALHVACQNGHTKLAALLIEQGACVNARDDFGTTPLMHAAQYNEELVELLLAKGADPLIGTDRTALHEAVACNQKKILDYFFSKGLSITTQSKMGISLLHTAAEEGNLSLVDYLINKGADISIQDAEGNTTIHSAARYNYTMQSIKHIIGLALNKGLGIDVKNKHNITPLYIASALGNINVAECLLDSGADLCTTATFDLGYMPLDCALESDHSKVVELLLSRGATSVLYPNHKYIPEALRRHEAVKTFTKESNFKALKELIQNGSYATPAARELIEQKYRQFYRAITQDNVETVKSLAAQGVSLTIPDTLGNTPLHRAVATASAKVIEFLLQNKKVDITTRNNAGQTALENAISRPGKALQVFIEYGYRKQLREQNR